VEMSRLGAKMGYLDVGGGLGVDYDGSKTNFYASKNYNIQNYANDIVAELKDVCTEARLKMPTLISESGRAIAAHQSVLIFDVLGSSEVPALAIEPLQEEEPLLIRNLYDTYQSINDDNYQECYHDATQFKERAISLFNLGYLSLKERARAERLYWGCCHQILPIVRRQEYVPDDLEDLEKIMASIYY
ncbi:MAG: arginine decarboxylase, partial [Synechococcales cyanobacterium]